MLNSPSIQLGTLKSVLRRSGIVATVCSFNLAFIGHIRENENPSLADGPLCIQDYKDIAETFYYLGLGDWVFAVPPFRTLNKEHDGGYTEYFLNNGGTEDILSKARRMRNLVPSFLERCVNEVLATNPKVVGFTTTFSQIVPCLVLAKLLKRHKPSVHIVFGGSNCDGPMGVALQKAFPWIDIVVRGEAEHVIGPLFSDLTSAMDIQPHPGLCYWQEGEQIVNEMQDSQLAQMDEVPMPDYDEYFERLQVNSYRAELTPLISIPFESARGCWWGARKHCTFCGLNGSTMRFRSKAPETVLKELLILARRHGHLDFHAVDNIVDMHYFRDFLPRLRDAGCDFRLFYETKANLKKQHLRSMRESGVLGIQPGIESLSTPILRSMDKGVSALQNIRLLKWCSEFGITPSWNFIYGFPKEDPEEYGRMAKLIESLTHLIPPQSVTPLHLERFSPYHQRPDKYGLEIIGPKMKAYYHLVYPQGDASLLNDLAYSFEFRYDDGRNPKAYVAPLQQSVEVWRKHYIEGSNLTYRRGPGFLRISDRRPIGGGCDYSLEEVEAYIYHACDEGQTSSVLYRMLQTDGYTDIQQEDVEDFLREMTRLKLMYEEDGCYLSLAVAVSDTTHSRPDSVIKAQNSTDGIYPLVHAESK